VTVYWDWLGCWALLGLIIGVTSPSGMVLRVYDRWLMEHIALSIFSASDSSAALNQETSMMSAMAMWYCMHSHCYHHLLEAEDAIICHI